MKSFCIKTNNQKVINYLLNSFEYFPIDNIYFINKKFKNFENVIIHYKGNEINTFCNLLSDIIADCIIIYYEPLLIKRIINYNYFYFDNFEKKIIEESCYNFILLNEDKNLVFRKDEIWSAVYNYITQNKSTILDGFINFRLPEYLKTLNSIVDICVNSYIIEKEYTEFINLLKIYIDSKESETEIIHLVYSNSESILLDSNKRIIPIKENNFGAKYLSDISFSSNDYALNKLLSLLPKKLEIHLIEDGDDFINTLQLIFGNRVSICKDCNICRTYKVLTNNVKQ